MGLFRRNALRAIFVVCWCAGGVALLATGASDTQQYVACEPRSQHEPGRLNISAEADDFGLAPTCRSRLAFYIARNTKLRSVSGTLALETASRLVLARDDFVADLTGPTGGLWRGSIRVPDAEGSCASLDLRIEIQACHDASRQPMTCPAIRVRPNHVFRDRVIESESLNVCYD